MFAKKRWSPAFTQPSLVSHLSCNYEQHKTHTTIQVTTADCSESCGHLGSLRSARPAYGRGRRQKGIQNREAGRTEKRGRRLKNEAESCPEQAQRRRALFDALQPVPPRALSHREDRGPMEDHPAPHARAGEPSCRTGADDPQISSGQQRTISG